MQPRIALDLDQSLGSSGCVPWLLLVLTHHALPGRKVRQLPVESNAADVATHTQYAKYYIQILACTMHTYGHGSLKKPLLAVCTVIGSRDKPAIRYLDLVDGFMMTLLCTVLSAPIGTATPYTLQLVKSGPYYIVRPSEVLFFCQWMRLKDIDLALVGSRTLK